MARPTLVDKVEAMAALACVPRLRPSTLKVALRLLHHYNGQTGRCDPGVETLASATNMTERTVFDALSELERLGLFGILHRRGRGNTNLYRPDFEYIKGFNPPPRSALPKNGHELDDNLTGRSPKPDQVDTKNMSAASGEHMNEHVNQHLRVRHFADCQDSAAGPDGDARREEEEEEQRNEGILSLAGWANVLESRGVDKPMSFLTRTLVRVTEESGLEPSNATRLVVDCLPKAIDDPPIDISLNKLLSLAIAKLDGDDR